MHGRTKRWHRFCSGENRLHVARTIGDPDDRATCTTYAALSLFLAPVSDRSLLIRSAGEVGNEPITYAACRLGTLMV